MGTCPNASSSAKNKYSIIYAEARYTRPSPSHDICLTEVFRPTTSSFDNAIWPLLKLATNQWRLTIDYWNLNAEVPTIKAPIPNIIKLTDNIQRAQSLFAVPDVANGFYLVPMMEDSQSQFSFLRMPPLSWSWVIWTALSLHTTYVHKL